MEGGPAVPRWVGEDGPVSKPFQYCTLEAPAGFCTALLLWALLGVWVLRTTPMYVPRTHHVCNSPTGHSHNSFGAMFLGTPTIAQTAYLLRNPRTLNCTYNSVCGVREGEVDFCTGCCSHGQLSTWVHFACCPAMAAVYSAPTNCFPCKERQ